MKKKIKYIVILLALLLGILIGASVYFVKNKLSAKLLENDVTQIIDSINEINGYLMNGNLSNDDVFSIKDNYICKKYIGSNITDLKSKIENFYKYPYDNGFIYDNDVLYVCMPSICEDIVDINSYEVIDYDNDKILEMQNNYSSYSVHLIKDDNHWKIEYSVISCK